MSYRGPRELPKTDRARQNIINDRMAPGSNRGATRWARRDPRGQQRYQPAPTGGLICSAQFIASNTGSVAGVLGSSWGAQFGSIVNNGDIDGVFEVVPVGGVSAVHILQSGWYAMEIYAVIDGASDGDAVYIEAANLLPIVCAASGVQVAEAPAFVVQASCVPFFVYEDDLPFQVLAVAYGPAGAYVRESSLFVTRYSGADVN